MTRPRPGVLALVPRLVPIALLTLAALPLGVEEVTVLVIDRETRAGVFRAEVRAVEERPTPITGESWWTASATTDGEGEARFDREELEGLSLWWLVDAPGYAPAALHQDDPPRTVELTPGVEVELLVLDALGRRAPSVTVGWMLGCGHVPDSRIGLTDEFGLVSFEDVDPDGLAELWVSGRGVLADHPDVEWSEDGRSATVRCAPGVTQVGRVVDDRGRGIPGLYVGQPNRHRGPWSRTDADGEFELLGATDDELWLRGEDGEDLGFFAPATDLAPRTIRLEESDAPPATAIELVLSTPRGEPVEDVTARVVRESDGWNVRARTDERGVALVPVPLGRFRVRVGGGLTDHDEVLAEVNLATPRGARLELELRPRPTFALDLRRLPEGARLHLVSETDVRDVTDRLHEIPVPSGPAALRLDTAGTSRVRLLDPGEARPGAVLELFADPVRGQ